MVAEPRLGSSACRLWRSWSAPRFGCRRQLSALLVSMTSTASKSSAAVYGRLGRMGRPTLTERRKAQTRREIAETALALFARQGYDGVSAETIAEEAGGSLRTF